MIRGVLSGMFWGVVSVGLVASVVSLLRPLPQPEVPAEHPAAAPVAAPEAPAATPEPVAPPVPAAPEAVSEGLPETATAPDPAPSVAESPAVEMPAPSGLAAPLPAPVAAGDPATISPPVVDAPAGAAPDAGVASAPVPPMPPVVVSPPDPAASTPAPQAVPAAPAADEPDRMDSGAADAPAIARTEAAPAVPGVLAPVVQPDPPAPVEPAEPAPGPVVQPATEPAAPPETAAGPVPGLLATRPQPGLGAQVDGVRTDRLPRIGADPAPVAEAMPELARALDRNARAFDNPAAKPPFAILLLDDPASAVDLATLAQGDLALTLVIDPTAPGAAGRATLWRDAGQEVALLTNALPSRGRQSDYEVALESLMSAFPQALAFVDAAEGGLQGDRSSAAALVPGLAARGLGLVTWDRGLNAADQVARREGLPAAVIFRELDAADEAAPVIRRYLDRAAFKAQQDGRAMVLGRLRPETVAALAEWALDGRAAALALAPASALLRRP